MKINLANEVSALEVWRAERHLSIESQQAGFKGNFFEEVSEFYRANNDYEKIDALCDMLVFIINASDSINRRYDKCFETERVVWKDGNKYRDCEYHLENAMVLLMKCGICCTDDTLPVNYLISAIAALGYNPQKCLAETIKEISSRTGKYSNELKKFVKDKGAYTREDVEAMYAKDSNISNICIVDDILMWEVKIYYKDGTGATEKVRKWYKAEYDKCKQA